jgi:Putative bacterial sensory transduction regulator
MTLRLSAPLVFLALLPGHAQSTANANGGVITPAGMRSILHGMGLRFTEKPAGDSTEFDLPFNGRVVTLRSQTKSFHLSACFQPLVDPMKQNQWNREHFSTRADMDEQGCTSLEADIRFGGRFTNEMIEEFIGGYLTSATVFAKFVSEAPAAGAADRPKSPIGPMAWSQLGWNTKSATPSTDAAAPVPGRLQINRNISLKYDPERWKQTAPDRDGQLALEHSSGDGHAVIIAERISLPRGSVEDVALSNAQAADPKAKITFRAQRRINGVDVRFLKIEAEVDEVPMAYWGCFYGGEFGTVQVVAYTARPLVPEYNKDFMDLLNGLTVSK